MDKKERPKYPFSDVAHPKRGNANPSVQKQGFFKRDSWEKNRKYTKEEPSLFDRVLKFFRFAIITIVSLIILYVGYLFISKGESISSAKEIYKNLQLIGKNLKGLNTDSVPPLVANINNNLGDLELKASPLTVAPVLNAIPEALGEMQRITAALSSVSLQVAELKSRGFGLVFNDGAKFMALLQGLENNLVQLKTSMAKIRNVAAKFSAVPQEADGEYLAFTTDLERSTETLQSVIDILGRQGENHFLILFENPTEIRPSGGFTGSYGDLVMQAGAVRSIDANDIYYPEHFLTSKIIPPIQLQGIATRWGPQDANWFFDFPVSARKAMEFIENSMVYSERGVKFDGVISVNVRIIEDILKITGAIDIPEYKLTLTDENFLPEIQKEVETGVDKKPGQNPKRVLKYIMPVILKKLGSLSDSQKTDLLKMLEDRFAKKDIQFYFRDTILESLVTRYGGAGEVFALPSDFKGDYLAVVDGNVAGGKSDKFVSQKVDLMSQIDPLGAITDTLTVARKHSGQNERDWWYRSANQNYIKIFMPLTSRVQSAKGNSVKNITPSIDYSKSDYRTDPDLDTVERTKELLKDMNASMYKESGKSVFGTWFIVTAGKTGTLEVSYVNSKKVAVANGSKFQFILDKQSGVESDFTYSIEAPIGFRWEESKSQTFNYVNSKLPTRVIINLTLEKES